MDEATQNLLKQAVTALRWAQFNGAAKVATSQPLVDESPRPRPAPGGARAVDVAFAQPEAKEVAPSAPSVPSVTLAYPCGDPDSVVTLLWAGPSSARAGGCWEGSSGALLRNMISAMKLDPERVHAVTLVQPDDPAAVTDRPLPLSQQLAASSSKILLVFGERAAQLLFQVDASIENLRGGWRRLAGRDTMITYGPERLEQMPMFKAVTWKDLQGVMKKIEA